MDRLTVSLKDHFDALRAADLRAIELVREWTKERLESHNGLINKMERDRDQFANRIELNALKEAFNTNKEMTAKALTLAEGKTKGFDLVRGGIAFILGVFVSAAAIWASLNR